MSTHYKIVNSTQALTNSRLCFLSDDNFRNTDKAPTEDCMYEGDAGRETPCRKWHDNLCYCPLTHAFHIQPLQSDDHPIRGKHNLLRPKRWGWWHVPLLCSPCCITFVKALILQRCYSSSQDSLGHPAAGIYICLTFWFIGINASSGLHAVSYFEETNPELPRFGGIGCEKDEPAE